jgi:N-acetyl-anhydromuramyl-L-alanine amidase AmpD
MSTFIIDGRFVPAPKGITVTDYVFDGEPYFKCKTRTKPLQHLVLHETAGRTAKGCKKTLQRKGYGVHLILDRKGAVSCHGDLATEVMVHANQLNKTSIGIEVVNPYAPSIAKGMNIQTIAAQWWTWVPKGGSRLYVLPSDAQLKTLRVLIPWLCEQLKIPYIFPTAHLNKKQRKIKRWRLRAKPDPGVVAHGDFASHADGRYLLEDLISQVRP